MPVVAVLSGARYDYAALLDEVERVLASYGAATANYEGVASVVSERVAPVGRLPVEVTAPDGSVVAELGFGLHTTVEVTPAEASFSDPSGTQGDVVTIPDVDGVTYLLDGRAGRAGDHPVTGGVVVTAQPDEGFHLAVDATTRWEHDFDATWGPTAEPSEPASGTASGPWLPAVLVGLGMAALAALVLVGLRRRRRAPRA